MLIPDVDYYLYAHRRDAPEHVAARTWLTAALDGAEQIGVSELVLSAFVRIATNARIYARPSTPAEALAFCADVRGAGAAVVVGPSRRHWDVFADLVLAGGARANTVPDAYLAAIAIENNAGFVTHDRGFARFPGLRIVDPIAG